MEAFIPEIIRMMRIITIAGIGYAIIVGVERTIFISRIKTNDTLDVLTQLVAIVGLIVTVIILGVYAARVAMGY